MASRGRTFPIDIQVAERVRTARLTQRLSQQKVAEALGVSFQQIQKYEKGTNRISIGRLHAIANILGVPMSYFLEGLNLSTSMAGPGVDAQAVNAALKTKEGVRVAAALSHIQNMGIRRHIADLLEAIIAAEREESGFVN
jgi:transcriptional regulator with XRE-family HTH domain